MMSNYNPVRPEDILPDGVDGTRFNGKVVRKGTIAAFLANVEIFENPDATEKQQLEALDVMKALAADVITIGLHKHVVFKNPLIEQILVNAKIS